MFKNFRFLAVRDTLLITLGLVSYASGWCFFLLPYQITTGGVTGLAAIVYYVTGTPIQVTFLLINAALLLVAFYTLGIRFCLKTVYAVAALTFLLWFFQVLARDDSGTLIQIVGPGQDFMACVIGSVLMGLGFAVCFLNNGSTGGTDIIAAIVNRHRNISFGRIILYCDIVIISSCFFIFHDWRRVVFGFVTLFIASYVLDLVVNGARQSVQFLIFSKEYQKIADRIITTGRGVTMLDGTGWYSRQPVKVLVVLARRSQSVELFRMIRDEDPNAFVSQSSVIGVYGEGFDRIKVR